MKRFLSTIGLLALLLFAQPVHAGTWADDVLDWFRGLFNSAPETSQTVSPAQLDSLRNSPLGLVLAATPDADTLAIEAGWPRESLTVESDLERHQRLLAQTVLLTSPAGKLPLETPAVRVIYRSDQRPVEFLRMARRFADVQEVAFEAALPAVLPVAEDLPTIVVADDPQGVSPMNSDWYTKLFTVLEDETTTLVHFGDVQRMAIPPADWSILQNPLRCRESEHLIAQALFGAQVIDGRLATTTPAYAAGSGYRLVADRGGFRLPELLGVDRELLQKADYSIQRGIRYRAMPGAQLLVMKDGHVIYEQAYGHQQYRKHAVTPGDLYDLASITKAAATTLAVMKLYDRGEITLDARVRDYLPEYKKNIVGRYRVDQLLSHQTGLQANLPVGDFLSREFVADTLSEDFGVAVGPDSYLRSDIPGLIPATLTGKLDYTRRSMYRYSDLNYYLLQLIVERLTGEPLDKFVAREVYEPLELGRLTYNPSGYFPAERLVPTIYEPWMRGGMLRGYVQDEGAALLGGVAGHAGLFGNAHDLARLFHVLLTDGEYRGRQIFTPETIALFTERSPYNYRALGFDRLAGGWGNVINAGAGESTFGHLGFSGTSVWADAENQLVFVLLTNRVSPDPKNNKFQRMDIRGRTHRAVYRSLNSYQRAS